MKLLPCRPEAGHGAIHNQGGARQISGVFQDSDKQEQNQDLRQKHQDASDAVKDSVDHQRAQGRVGNQGAHPGSCRGDGALHQVHHRLGPEKDRLEHGDDHDHEHQRSAHGMQKNRIQTARPVRRRRRLILALGADIRGPGPALGNILDHRQLHQRRGLGSRVGGARQELQNLVESFAARRADQSHRRSQLHAQFGHVHAAAAARQIVGHVQDHQRRQTQAEHGRRQHQMTRQVGRIEDQQYGIRLGQILHLAEQNVVGDALVFGAGFQAIDAGEIDGENFAAALHLDLAHAMFHRHAGEVRYFLAQAGEPVEQGRFAGVGRSDDRHDVAARIDRQREGCDRATVAIAHKSKSRHLRRGGVFPPQNQPPRGLAPQRNFGSIHAEYARIAARRRMTRRNCVPG